MTGTARGKVVFIAHAYRGDEEANLKQVERYVRYAISEGEHPCCPWYAMVRSLNDSDDAVRERGLEANLEILTRCDELWACGKVISQGVQNEIDRAWGLRIPIRYVELDP